MCYIKFGANAPGPDAEQSFNSLLDACERMAFSRNLSRLVAGVNMGREQAYRCMMQRGFTTDIQGVVMDRPNEAGYNRRDVYLIDDWR